MATVEGMGGEWSSEVEKPRCNAAMRCMERFEQDLYETDRDEEHCRNPYTII